MNPQSELMNQVRPRLCGPPWSPGECVRQRRGDTGEGKKKKEKRKERTRASVFKQREEEKRKVLAGMI